MFGRFHSASCPLCEDKLMFREKTVVFLGTILLASEQF